MDHNSDMTEVSEWPDHDEKENNARNPWTYRRATYDIGTTKRWKYHKKDGHRKYRKLLRDKYTLSNERTVIPHSELLDPWSSSRDRDSFNRLICDSDADSWFQRQWFVTKPNIIKSYKHKQRKMNLSKLSSELSYEDPMKYRRTPLITNRTETDSEDSSEDEESEGYISES